MMPNFGAPVLAVCGFSGSGKTTLLEAVIPHLIAQNLSVAVVKHDAHGFVVDREGKDSDRLFRAGATIALRGPGEQFARRNAASSLTLQATLADLAQDHDLLLVEGHKDTPLPKLWVGDVEATPPPAEVSDILRILSWDSDRLKIFLDFIAEWLPGAWRMRPLHAGLLVGGKSSRMGTPKQLLRFDHGTLGEIAAHALQAGIAQSGTAPPDLVALGAGVLPFSLQHLIQLADAPDLAGPLAGLLAAHRWSPRTAWVLVACDHPWVSPAEIQELIDQRSPGRWAVLARQPDGGPCPTLGLYEPQALALLERSILARGPEKACIAWLLDHPRTWVGPRHLHGTVDVNTPEELSAEKRTLAHSCSGSAKKSLFILGKGNHHDDEF